MKGDRPIVHRVSWRYFSRDTNCNVIVREKNSEDWVYFLDADSGDTVGYFHPDDIDGIIVALNAAKKEIGR